MRRQTRTEFRHDPTDKQRWLAAADACGLTLSEFARAALDHAAEGMALPQRQPKIVLTRMDPAALAHLTGACNNLNQAVHAGHIEKHMDLHRIASIADEIAVIVRADLALRGLRQEAG